MKVLLSMRPTNLVLIELQFNNSTIKDGVVDHQGDNLVMEPFKPDTRVFLIVLAS